MAIQISRFVKESWLNVEELQRAANLPLITRITRVYAKQIQKEMKLVIVLEGLERHLPLNQINLRTLQEAKPDLQDALLWQGWEVEVYLDEDVAVRGESMMGIRLQVTSMDVPEEMKAPAKPNRPLFASLRGSDAKEGKK